jgi:type 2 lantibiotic biosynthesis protein LanM
VRIEAAFGALASWFARGGFHPEIRVSRVVEGNGYGWVEAAANEPFESEEDVRRYFRQAGALIFITHLLGSRDLHMENVVATREGPVIIDLELLLQPELKPATESDADRSCLRTGLLSLVEFGPGDDVFDVGGLRGNGRVPLASARRSWRNLGTDAIAYTDETVAQAGVKNGVVLNGRLQPPDSYRAEILDGFSTAYAFVRAHRGGFPLDAFRNAMVRVIARPTNQYALLTTVQSAPRYQQDGAVASMLADVLIRPLAGAVERPREWPLIVEERRNIEALDVPRFVVPAEDRSLMSAGRVVLEDYFARSPLDSVRERLDALSDDDCGQQSRALDRALADSIESRFSTPFEAGHDDFGNAAEWIGRELLARATRSGEAIVWSPDDPNRASSHYLYGWSLGPAVFLSALAASTGAGEWQRAARAATALALAWAETGLADRDQAIGGSSGLGSIVYGLTTCAALTGDERLLAAAGRVAAMIDADRISQDPSYDIVDGAAGALLALLALHRVSGDHRLLDAARACGDYLVNARIEHAAGWTWPPASPGDSRRLVGFAHGAAGIGAALARLAETTGAESYRRAAERAFAFVARNFTESDANWPVAEADADDISTTIIRMSAWCHGAPGIALALRLAGPCARPEPGDAISTTMRQAAMAIERIPEWAPNQTDHVCCGHLGRVDVLLTAGPALGSADAVSRARTIASRVLARARRKQHFRLSAPGFEYRVFDPGFFKGLSGIGYGLLRLANPERLPSIAAFETRQP